MSYYRIVYQPPSSAFTQFTLITIFTRRRVKTNTHTLWTIKHEEGKLSLSSYTEERTEEMVTFSLRVAHRQLKGAHVPCSPSRPVGPVDLCSHRGRISSVTERTRSVTDRPTTGSRRSKRRESSLRGRN